MGKKVEGGGGAFPRACDHMGHKDKSQGLALEISNVTNWKVSFLMLSSAEG